MPNQSLKMYQKPISVLLVLGLAAYTSAWQLGPFEKQDSVNPIMGPEPTTTFFCPVRQEEVKWEEKDVFNPTALVKDGKVHLIYRAEDVVGAYKGTSRIGLAVSSDGLHFDREILPIFYPANDSAQIYEWEGGCEDPRIVEDAQGTYYLTYTGYNGSLARLMVATSKDLRTWTKHGLAFGQARNGSYNELWSKSGSVVTTLQSDGKFVATKLQGKYWMYWGESDIFAATSDDLVNWTPVLKTPDSPANELLTIFAPRPGNFDSWLVEPGPQSIIVENGTGILLIYNSKNRDPNNGGDPNLPLGTYSAGQVLLNVTNPTQLLDRTEDYFITPDKDYEVIGQVNNVVFVEGLVHFQNKWFLYYGTADSKIAVATID